MPAETPYTATVLPNPNAIKGVIDVVPPFAPGEPFLERCGRLTETVLGHFATTQTTTRLTIQLAEHIQRLNTPLAVRQDYLQRAASYVAWELNSIEQGKVISPL
jgi:hypothetical protein